MHYGASINKTLGIRNISYKWSTLVHQFSHVYEVGECLKLI